MQHQLRIIKRAHTDFEDRAHLPVSIPVGKETAVRLAALMKFKSS